MGHRIRRNGFEPALGSWVPCGNDERAVSGALQAAPREIAHKPVIVLSLALLLIESIRRRRR